jgi:gluconolactonase
MITTIPAELDVLDERFRDCHGDDRVERLDLGCRWAEGPVYVPAGRYLLVSDIPNDRILRWDEITGAFGEFRHPAGYANGNTLDAEGRLVTCEHGNRRVTRTEHDGSITVLADRYDGKRFNSPNDVVVRSDGSVWFTDPAYGIDSDYEGYRAESEIGGCYVYRLDPATGACAIVADDFVRPNGLAFSLDEAQLYIADSRVTSGCST